jgi:hypothetical protein
MATNIDLSLDNNDVAIFNGDFYFAESDQQHIIDTINAFPGWWKEYPADGVGLMAYSKAPADLQALSRSIKINLQSDGYQLQNPSVVLDVTGQLIIDPKATKS